MGGTGFCIAWERLLAARMGSFASKVGSLSILHGTRQAVLLKVGIASVRSAIARREGLTCTMFVSGVTVASIAWQLCVVVGTPSSPCSPPRRANHVGGGRGSGGHCGRRCHDRKPAHPDTVRCLGRATLAGAGCVSRLVQERGVRRRPRRPAHGSNHRTYR